MALAVLAVGCGSHPGGVSGSGDQPVAQSSSAPAVLHVVSVTPHKLTPTAPIIVTYDSTLTSTSPMPTLSPAVPGQWARQGSSATFTPAQAYPPDTTLAVRGVLRTGHAAHLLAHRATPHGSLVRAEQILADLHYLPLRTTAQEPTDAAARAAAVYSPPAGKFRWRYGNVPAALHAGFTAGKPGSVLRGAVVAFQHVAKLSADGSIGRDTWQALLKADASHHIDPNPYSYVYADLYEPQRLSVWVKGKTVLTSPVNGGVASAPTPLGTFPVYERLTSTTMQGTNPDGSHYKDPGVPWVNYFTGGSAVHGFPRASYGSPQSVGCLELPIATAAQVYQLISYGTLVTVSGPQVTAPSTVAKPQAPSGHTNSSSPKPTHSPSATATPKSSPTPTKSHHKH